MSKRRGKREHLVRAHEPTEAELARQDLADAVQRLQAAAAGLVDGEVASLDGRLVEAMSLYEELRECLGGGGPTDCSGKSATLARSPIWVSAFSLLDEIDTAIRIWSDVADTPSGIRELAARRWTTDDTHRVIQVARAIEDWTKQAEALMNPRSVQVRRACPACSERYVYKRDSCGDRVRTPTLQLDSEGVKCLACRASWTYAQAHFLQRLLEAEDQKELEHAA